MKPVEIDFAPASPARTLARTGAPAWIGMALAIVLCAAAALQFAELRQARRALERERGAAARSAARQASAAPPAAPRLAPEQLAAVNGIVLRLNLPWGDLREAIAAATPRTVALLALEPDARARRLRLTAEAASAEAMIAYLERLKRQERFVSVVLTHHEIAEQDDGKPIRFEVELAWETR